MNQLLADAVGKSATPNPGSRALLKDATATFYKGGPGSGPRPGGGRGKQSDTKMPFRPNTSGEAFHNVLTSSGFTHNSTTMGAKGGQEGARASYSNSKGQTVVVERHGNGDHAVEGQSHLYAAASKQANAMSARANSPSSHLKAGAAHVTAAWAARDNGDNARYKMHMQADRTHNTASHK